MATYMWGTFPSEKVFQYDPETKKFRDYGQ